MSFHKMLMATILKPYTRAVHRVLLHGTRHVPYVTRPRVRYIRLVPETFHTRCAGNVRLCNSVVTSPAGQRDWSTCTIWPALLEGTRRPRRVECIFVQFVMKFTW